MLRVKQSPDGEKRLPAVSLQRGCTGGILAELLLYGEIEPLR
jgi:hypothetical protein